MSICLIVLADVASSVTVQSARSTDAMLSHMHAMLAYAQAHKSVLKLRDQKQLDFEELTDYLSNVVSERDRLASLGSPYGHGHGGVRGPGLGGYLRDRVDSLRGVDEERTRVERMQRLDGRIKEVSEPFLPRCRLEPRDWTDSLTIVFACVRTVTRCGYECPRYLASVQ